jgi:type 1 glutamine amidotransferase
MRRRLIFHVGGPDHHPVNQQAATIIEWLGPEYACHTAESLAAFEHLNECDLLVLMGMHWTGWEGRYRSPSDVHRRALEKYINSGRPIISAHGAIASYDDWPGFGEMVGYTYLWGVTSQTPLADYRVRVLPSGHPIVSGVEDYTIFDELYYDIRISPGMEATIHAMAEWENKRLPMIMTAEGGRLPGAGKTTYIANGHDMRSFECPALRQIWLNAIHWSLSE